MSDPTRRLLNDDEETAMARLADFMTDLRRWGLSANEGEMTAAVHVLQGFVIQHAIERQFAGFNSWFREVRTGESWEARHPHWRDQEAINKRLSSTSTVTRTTP